MSENISLKTRIEVNRMRRAGLAAESVLYQLAPEIRQGVTTQQLEEASHELAATAGATLALKGYRGYRHGICTSVNHVAAHGVPGHYRLQQGDIITVDAILECDGWFGDAAWTYSVDDTDFDTRRLLRAAWQSSVAGIRAARAGKRFGDIGAAVSAAARAFGCSVLDNFVGHGIGRDMHEDPMVLNSGEPGVGSPIVPGMVFTVEPILCLGSPEVKTMDDGWSVITLDKSRCAQFEHTIAIFADATEILTSSMGDKLLSLDFPPTLQ